jgi:ABC-type transporter Mla subunit MlaD
MASINQRLTSLSDQIDRRFETLQAIVVEGRRTLSVLAEQIQTMGVTIADLGKNNQNLSQRLSETSQRLDTLSKSVQTLTVAKRTPIARKQPASATQPPFQIDAIDQWDDQTYVVVSQAGQVAFLKAGEQQSGWTLTHIDRLTGQVTFTGPAGTAYSVSVAR